MKFEMKVGQIGHRGLIVSKITSSLQPNFQEFRHHALHDNALCTSAFKKGS